MRSRPTDLASKAIVERLDAAGAAAVGPGPDRITSTALGDLCPVADAMDAARTEARKGKTEDAAGIVRNQMR